VAGDFDFFDVRQSRRLTLTGGLGGRFGAHVWVPFAKGLGRRQVDCCSIAGERSGPGDWILGALIQAINRARTTHRVQKCRSFASKWGLEKRREMSKMTSGDPGRRHGPIILLKNMVNIGVIGLGPVWDTRYAPVLQKYRDRICLRAVYDPVIERAEKVAAQWLAVPVHGALALLNRTDVRAVLLLDSSWHGLRTLEFARERRKPTYIAACLGSDAACLKKLHDAGRAEGLTLMPEMSRRHAPSTVRLHELMATQLGRAKTIEIEAFIWRDGPSVGIKESDAELVVGLVDWCRYVARSPILQVEMTSELSSGIGGPNLHTITIQFAPPRAQSAGAAAVLRIYENAQQQSSVHYQITCERGTAKIDSAVEIQWQTETGKPVSETLTSDRSDVEVLIDHFCRRVVGGLIPVPDIADVCRGLEVMGAARRSLASGQSVLLNGQV
jgi:predicted dehydrogenase